MGAETEISWADSTFNPWIGCTKVGPGCDHCYALDRDIRFSGGRHWGINAPRQRTKGPWRDMLKWDRRADHFKLEHGRRRRVMVGSMCDIFDNEIDHGWQRDAFDLIETSTDIDVLLITKRISNVDRLVPDWWRNGDWPGHVGLIATMCNQAEANRDAPRLLELKMRRAIPWVGASYEPALGPIDWTKIRAIVDGTDVQINALNGDAWVMNSDSAAAYSGADDGNPVLDWIIAGGESGPSARPANPDWFRATRDQCAAAGTAFHFKQWGEWMPCPEAATADAAITYAGEWAVGENCWSFIGTHADTARLIRPGKARAGRLLDGILHDAFPQALTRG